MTAKYRGTVRAITGSMDGFPAEGPKRSCHWVCTTPGWAPRPMPSYYIPESGRMSYSLNGLVLWLLYVRDRGVHTIFTLYTLL